MALTSPAPNASGRAGLWLGAALALLAVLPFLLAREPQLTDYASHLARYHVLLDGARSEWLARYYAIDWHWTGNLGADLLIRPLAAVFGLERAGWLIGAVIPPLTGLGIVAVEWTLRRRVGVGALLALATVWSPAMAMGFYNFCLSLALALFGFAAWVRLEGRRWRWVPFVPLGLAIWLCHLSGWGVLGLLVFGYEWSRNKDWRAFVAPWPLFPAMIPVLLTQEASGALSYGANVFAYKKAIWLQALRDQSMPLDIATLAVLVLAILVAAWFRRIDGRLGWAALLFALASLVVPRHLGGGDYADYRLIAVALTVGCLAIDVPRPRWLVLLAAAPFLVRLAVTAGAWQANGQAMDRMLTVIDHLPQGARVAGAVALPRSRWAIDPFEHLPSYAAVRRDALVNTHFAIPGVHALRLREGSAKFVDPWHRVFYVPGQPIDLATFEPAREADWLWYVGRVEPARLPEGAVIVHRAPGTFLARLANRPPAR